MSEQTNTAGREAFQAEFEALPLDEKFARLFKMEVATLGETFKQVEETSVEVLHKFGETMKDLGQKIDTEFKKAACGEPAAAAPPPEPTPEPAASANWTEGRDNRGGEVN